jgi:hypothetical protein
MGVGGVHDDTGDHFAILFRILLDLTRICTAQSNCQSMLEIHVLESGCNFFRRLLLPSCKVSPDPTTSGYVRAFVLQ